MITSGNYETVKSSTKKVARKLSSLIQIEPLEAALKGVRKEVVIIAKGYISFKMYLMY